MRCNDIVILLQLCFVLLCVLPVRYLARGQHKSLLLSIRSCAPMDKTHGLSVLCSSSLQYCLKMSSRKTDLDHLSVVCNDLSMMVYHIVTSVSGYVHVSYSEKLYRCPPYTSILARNGLFYARYFSQALKTSAFSS